MSQLAIAKDLVTLGNDVLFAFRRASGAFARHRDEFQIVSSSEAACKAELQRFQLWVINLGLFQSSHNSLDYRLRQNETVRSMIAALLTDLCLALDDLFDELSRDTNNNNDDAKELESEMHSGSGANVEAQSFQSADRSEVSNSSSGNVDEENLTTMYMDDVIEINDELMKIAMQIRSPSSRKPRHKTYTPGGTELDDQDVYTNVLKSFRKKGIEQTLLSARLRTLSIDRAETSPVLRDSDEFLVDRLSKANDFRRQQFEYWRKYRSHSVRATSNATGGANTDKSRDKVQPLAMLTPTADVAFVRSDDKGPKTVSMPSVSFLAPDFKLRSVRSARTHQSRALTVHTPGGDLIAWPEVPPSPDTLYESRDQWIQHEQWSHMCLWRCPKDDIEFEDLPSYEIHVIAQHPVAAEKNQLLSEGVLATQRFLAEPPSRSCPFCDVDLDGLGEMCDHIGSHLETVALLAIPQLDDHELQPKSDAASSVAAGKDADGSRKNDFDEALPLTFPENDDSDEWSPAEQDLSGLDFEFHLARVPEQALNQSVWVTNVIRSDIEHPAPQQSSQQGISAVPPVSSPRNPFQTRNLQQDERLSGHWRTAKFPCFMMDTHIRNQDFFGRGRVLQALDNVLLPSLHRQSDTEKGRHAVLCGIGGIGKTSIAVQFAFSRGVHFDAVFWVNAATLSKLEHSFAEIAVKLGLVDTLEQSDHVILRELVKGWLENPQKPVIDDNHSMIQVEAHWLLVFDGADRPEILHDYWPLPNTGSILTTSRDPLSKSINSFTTAGIDVLAFEDEESAALLQRLCPDNDGHVESDTLSLAEMSGGNPLVIGRMAEFMRHHKLTFASYLSMCRADPGLLERLSGDVGASTLSTAIEELDTRAMALRLKYVQSWAPTTSKTAYLLRASQKRIS
ncbi:MAG: hypothetical protein Q9199_003938 [Rusavskia elegans]